MMPHRQLPEAEYAAIKAVWNFGHADGSGFPLLVPGKTDVNLFSEVGSLIHFSSSVNELAVYASRGDTLVVVTYLATDTMSGLGVTDCPWGYRIRRSPANLSGAGTLLPRASAVLSEAPRQGKADS